MNEFIKKLIERLEELEVQAYDKMDGGVTYQAYRNAIEIVDQLAEEYKPCNKPSCKDCEVYDTEKHYCPKWCDVIKHTTEELAEEYKNESVKGDLISRSALIKTLNEYVTKAYDCGGIDGENVIEYQQTHDDKSAYIIQGFNEVYELLEDVPTAYNDDWIPCITALPEEKKVYLEILDIWSDVSDCVWVTLKNSEVAHAYMENGKWYYSTGIIIETDVIAWKPLDKPAPYQPKGDNNGI